jgi:outer membrane protein TolC
VTAEGELLRLEVELDRARNDVVFTDVELTRQRAKLTPYMAAHAGETDPGSITIAVSTSDVFSIELLPGLEAAQAMGRARRPEVVMGRARMAAADASISYERALSVRQTGATFGNKRTGAVNSMVAALSLTIPLFHTNGSGVARATHERQAVSHELEWAERLVAADIQSAHVSALRLTEQLNELRRTFLARATDVHRLTLGAYQEGGATLLQVLDATRMLADARMTYARTLFAQRESVFRLALATGADPLDALDVLRTWSAAPARAARAGEQP